MAFIILEGSWYKTGRTNLLRKRLTSSAITLYFSIPRSCSTFLHFVPLLRSNICYCGNAAAYLRPRLNAWKRSNFPLSSRLFVKVTRRVLGLEMHEKCYWYGMVCICTCCLACEVLERPTPRLLTILNSFYLHVLPVVPACGWGLRIETSTSTEARLQHEIGDEQYGRIEDVPVVQELSSIEQFSLRRSLEHDE